MLAGFVACVLLVVFTLPFGVIVWLCSAIVVPGHLLYYFESYHEKYGLITAFADNLRFPDLREVHFSQCCLSCFPLDVNVLFFLHIRCC